MRVLKGLFYDQYVIIQDGISDYAWEGKIKGLTCEAGGCYFYIVETSDNDVYYLPREAVQYIKPVQKINDNTPKSIIKTLSVGEVFNSKGIEGNPKS